MKISRRNFIASTPAAIALVTQMGSITSARTLIARDPLAKMTSAVFLPYVGTDFTFRSSGSETVTLRLADLEIRTPAGYAATGRGDECFALKFTGPARQPIVQDTYSVDHFALRSFSLFITENGGNSGTRVYIALINRLTH